MIRTFAKGIISTIHGSVSTLLDVFTGVDPKTRDTLNQELNEKIKAREYREKLAEKREGEMRLDREFKRKHGINFKRGKRL